MLSLCLPGNPSWDWVGIVGHCAVALSTWKSFMGLGGLCAVALSTWKSFTGLGGLCAVALSTWKSFMGLGGLCAVALSTWNSFMGLVGHFYLVILHETGWAFVLSLCLPGNRSCDWVGMVIVHVTG